MSGAFAASDRNAHRWLEPTSGRYTRPDPWGGLIVLKEYSTSMCTPKPNPSHSPTL
jgi:hypothetical protein